MTPTEIRQKLHHQIDQLPSDLLTLVDEFLELLKFRRGQAPETPVVSQLSHPLKGLTREERIAKIRTAVGGWQDDAEITDIFAAIDQERHAYHGRAIATLDDE